MENKKYAKGLTKLEYMRIWQNNNRTRIKEYSAKYYSNPEENLINKGNQ